MLDFGTLDRIAKGASASAGGLRDDAYQEAWIRFLIYSPRNRSGAWLMACSARNDLWNKERTQRRMMEMLCGLRPPPWGHLPHTPSPYTPEERKARRLAKHKVWRQKWRAENLEEARRRDREHIRAWRAKKRSENRA